MLSGRSSSLSRVCLVPFPNSSKLGSDHLNDADPTKLAEADPADINDWTNGLALMATGSPFPPVKTPRGKEHKIAEA